MSAVIGIVLAIVAIWLLIKVVGLVFKIIAVALLIGAAVFAYHWIKRRV